VELDVSRDFANRLQHEVGRQVSCEAALEVDEADRNVGGVEGKDNVVIVEVLAARPRGWAPQESCLHEESEFLTYELRVVVEISVVVVDLG
jgi:hypothetical protein